MSGFISWGTVKPGVLAGRIRRYGRPIRFVAIGRLVIAW